jgi:hypothetical protein
VLKGVANVEDFIKAVNHYCTNCDGAERAISERARGALVDGREELPSMLLALIAVAPR